MSESVTAAPCLLETNGALLASVVVPARNAGCALGDLIDALSRQTISTKRFEVVLADDGSTDGSIESLETGDLQVRVTSGAPTTSYAARNRGASISRARTLAFCDADCIPAPDWLEQGLDALENVQIAVGAVRFVPPNRATAWGLVDMEWFLDARRMVERGGVLTCNLFIHRATFERLGGFDHSLPSGGDYEFGTRARSAGIEPLYIDSAVVRHPTRQGPSELLRKIWRVNYSAGTLEYRAGRRPSILKRFYIPFLGVGLSRRRQGRPLGLDRARLLESGVTTTFLDDLRAAPLIYLVIPYLALAARHRGWRAAARSSAE